MARCLITNPQRQNDRLAILLRARGVDVVQMPLQRVEPPQDGGKMLAATLADFSSVDWCMFSSKLAVEYFLTAWGERQLPSQIEVAAVGSSTADLLREGGIEPALVGTRDGEVVALRLAQQAMDGKSVVSFQAEGGCEGWHVHLQQAGATVTMVPTHRLVAGDFDRGAWEADHTQTPIDAMLFTAPSTVELFCQHFPVTDRCAALAKARCFAIGPTTARTIMAHGLHLDGISRDPGFAAFARFVANALSQEGARNGTDN
jgi:uroporphyrinogen-III synthase